MITQATERGTIYTLGELQEISNLARACGLRLHMDGARFSNALVELGVTPAEMSWKSGVDILTFGTTKNGTMNAEAVKTFDPKLAYKLRFLQKRAGFLVSKMRFVAAQLLSYLEDDLWQKNAKAANQVAKRVSEAIEATPGSQLIFPVETNQVFAAFSKDQVAQLREDDFNLRPWPLKEKRNAHRMVFSYHEDTIAISRLVDCFRRTQGRDFDKIHKTQR
ncbi:MAG: hypothetical protein HON65_00640 [Rhodospirillales bacterium]|nr:hypothetical protein [Rhodospirillales bacterium]